MLYSRRLPFQADFQRRQIPYNLKAIPELQIYLKEVAFKTSQHLNYIPKPQVAIPTPPKRRIINATSGLNQLFGPHLQSTKYVLNPSS